MQSEEDGPRRTCGTLRRRYSNRFRRIRCAEDPGNGVMLKMVTCVAVSPIMGYVHIRNKRRFAERIIGFGNCPEG